MNPIQIVDIYNRVVYNHRDRPSYDALLLRLLLLVASLMRNSREFDLA
jgi:hypothetical protein